MYNPDKPREDDAGDPVTGFFPVATPSYIATHGGVAVYEEVTYGTAALYLDEGFYTRADLEEMLKCIDLMNKGVSNGNLK